MKSDQSCGTEVLDCNWRKKNLIVLKAPSYCNSNSTMFVTFLCVVVAVGANGYHGATSGEVHMSVTTLLTKFSVAASV